MSDTQTQIKVYASALLFWTPFASLVAANAEALSNYAASSILFIMSFAGLALVFWGWLGMHKEMRLRFYEIPLIYLFAMIFFAGLYVANFGYISFFVAYALIALSLAIPALIKMISKSRSVIAEAREASEAPHQQQQITGPRRDAD